MMVNADAIKLIQQLREGAIQSNVFNSSETGIEPFALGLSAHSWVNLVWCLINKLNQFRAFCPDTSLLVVAIALLRLLLAPCLGPKCIRSYFNVFVRHHTSLSH
jgi:hypothetical protein